VDEEPDVRWWHHGLKNVENDWLDYYFLNENSKLKLEDMSDRKNWRRMIYRSPFIKFWYLNFELKTGSG
jgi:hypothetical protein